MHVPSIFKVVIKVQDDLQCFKLILRIFMNVHEFLSFFLRFGNFFVGRSGNIFLSTSLRIIWKLLWNAIREPRPPQGDLKGDFKCKLSIIERTFIRKYSGITKMPFQINASSSASDWVMFTQRQSDWLRVPWRQQLFETPFKGVQYNRC